MRNPCTEKHPNWKRGDGIEGADNHLLSFGSGVGFIGRVCTEIEWSRFTNPTVQWRIVIVDKDGTTGRFTHWNETPGR